MVFLIPIHFTLNLYCLLMGMRSLFLADVNAVRETMLAGEESMYNFKKSKGCKCFCQ